MSVDAQCRDDGALLAYLKMETDSVESLGARKTIFFRETLNSTGNDHGGISEVDIQRTVR